MFSPGLLLYYFAQRVGNAWQLKIPRKQESDRRKRMDRDLAGQNDTSYQGQPTGLLHGDKLHLRFHSSLSNFQIRLLKHFRYAIDDACNARRNFSVDHGEETRGRSVFRIRLIEGERKRGRYRLLLYRALQIFNDILFIYFFLPSLIHYQNFRVNIRFI